MKNIANSPVKKALLLSLLLTGSGNLYAEKEDNRNPLGCNDVGYEFVMDTLHLVPGKAGPSQSLYFLFNTLREKVTLYQMRDEDSSHSMYLNHAINPEQWAVLSTTERKVKYICTVPDGKSQYGKIVDCATSLRICEYTNVKYGMNNRGNYWLVNSNTRNGAIREVVRYGIIPAI
ncbi:MAG: endopeptidase IV [Legionella sp.]|nr:endopeptidase IV [Legionella sp.]